MTPWFPSLKYLVMEDLKFTAEAQRIPVYFFVSALSEVKSGTCGQGIFEHFGCVLSG
jgi:hypothetical protein